MSYNDLLQENYRLKLALERVSTPQDGEAEHPAPQPAVDEDFDTFEGRLFGPRNEQFPSVRNKWPNIILPSQSCSMALVEFDRIWNSWVHAALDHPMFEIEHVQFWAKLESGDSIDIMDPSWLALYFSVIAVGFLGFLTPPSYVQRTAHEFLGSITHCGRR